MTVNLNSGRVISSSPSAPLVTEDERRDLDSDTVPVGPLQRLVLGSDQLDNRDVSLLLALALAEGSRELAKMQRESARTIVEGQLAILMGMIRLEPKISAVLEDVRFVKTMVMTSGEIVTSVASAGKPQKKKHKKKDSDPKPVGKFNLKGLLARPRIATNLGRFTALRDRLVLTNPRARYVLARNAAVADLNGRFADNPVGREAWLKAETKTHETRLVSEASARASANIDDRDWYLGSPSSGDADADMTKMLRTVYGDDPTAAQEALVGEAIATLGDRRHVLTGQMMTRGEFADLIEPTFDTPDGRVLMTAIRDGQVDLTLPMRDVHGNVKQPRVGVGTIAKESLGHLNKAWDDGWGKDEQEAPQAIQGISATEQQILDAWYARLLESRLEAIQWSARYADIFTDVADIAMGIDDN